MLQALRSKGASIVVKVMFGFLILSFAIWGIGDYTFARRGDPAVVTVGDVKIPASRVSDEYRRELERMRRVFGQLDPEQARQLGLADRVIDRLVTSTVLDKELHRLGLKIGDDTVRERILAEPMFQGPGGFDRQQYQRLLSDNGLSEARFVELTRNELARAQLTGAIEAGAAIPDLLIDRIYRYRQEKRSGVTVLVDPASIGDVGEPDEAAIKAFYEENGDAFMAPEYRDLTVVRIGTEEIMSQIQIDEPQLREEYEARLAELRVPERREIEQALFIDQASADAAAAKLAGGAAFADVLRDAGQGPEQAALGLVAKADLLPELAEAVFAQQAGGTTTPVQTPLGWHILRINKIEPAREPSFDEVRDKLKTELAQRMADDAVYQTSTKMEDELAAGAKLDEAAAKLGLTAIRIAAVDSQGRTPTGGREPALTNDADLLGTAFSTAQGQVSPVVEIRGSYYVVQVNAVTPATKKPLEQVTADVVRLWQARKRDQAAKARAEEILAKAEAGATLAAAAESFGLKTAETPAVVRNADANAAGGHPPEVVVKLFELTPGKRAVVFTRAGYYVVELKDIVPAEPEKDPDGLAKLRAELRRSLGSDLVSQYGAALKRHFGVEIDRKAVEGLL